MDSHLPHNDGPSNSQVTITAANQRVLSYIEATFNAILQEIKARPGGKPVIMLKRTVAVRPYYDEDDMRRLKWLVEDREVRYCFPGKTKDEGWRFGMETSPSLLGALTSLSLCCPNPWGDAQGHQDGNHGDQEVSNITGVVKSVVHTMPGTSIITTQCFSNGRKPWTDMLTISLTPAR